MGNIYKALSISAFIAAIIYPLYYSSEINDLNSKIYDLNAKIIGVQKHVLTVARPGVERQLGNYGIKSEIISSIRRDGNIDLFTTRKLEFATVKDRCLGVINVYEKTIDLASECSTSINE